MPRILVIEDNETFSLMLCSVLRETGYEVAAAFSGSEGVKSALAFLPDLILLDYHLGDMTGYDVALGIRLMRATARTPFVLLSSMGDDPFMVGSFKKLSNCRAILGKNQPVPVILSAVDDALRTK
jgi:two-component system CheB/CheR fusion protein